MLPFQSSAAEAQAEENELERLDNTFGKGFCEKQTHFEQGSLPDAISERQSTFFHGESANT